MEVRIMPRPIETINRTMVAAHQDKVIVLGTVPKSMSKQHAYEFAAWLCIMADCIDDPECPEFGDVMEAIQNT